jgi:hypothetical protein
MCTALYDMHALALRHKQAPTDTQAEEVLEIRAREKKCIDTETNNLLLSGICF